MISKKFYVMSELVLPAVDIVRTGEFSYPDWFGTMEIEITDEHLEQMILNFEDDILQRPVCFNADHIGGESLGEIKSLKTEERTFGTGEQLVLVATVELTPEGEENISEKKRTMVSAEIQPNRKDTETGEEYGMTLIGAALTNRPLIPGLNPVMFSEDGTAFEFSEPPSSIGTDATPDEKTFLDPKAKVRNRPNPIFPAKSKYVKDARDHYPIDTENRARNALARAAQQKSTGTPPKWFNGSLDEFLKRVVAAVKKNWPSIEIDEEKFSAVHVDGKAIPGVLVINTHPFAEGTRTEGTRTGDFFEGKEYVMTNPKGAATPVEVLNSDRSDNSEKADVAKTTLDHEAKILSLEEAKTAQELLLAELKTAKETLEAKMLVLTEKNAILEDERLVAKVDNACNLLYKEGHVPAFVEGARKIMLEFRSRPFGEKIKLSETETVSSMVEAVLALASNIPKENRTVTDELTLFGEPDTQSTQDEKTFAEALKKALKNQHINVLQ